MKGINVYFSNNGDSYTEVSNRGDYVACRCFITWLGYILSARECVVCSLFIYNSPVSACWSMTEFDDGDGPASVGGSVVFSLVVCMSKDCMDSTV